MSAKCEQVRLGDLLSSARAVALVSAIRSGALSAGRTSTVEAWVEPENTASRHVLESAGFEVEGRLRSFLFAVHIPNTARSP